GCLYTSNVYRGWGVLANSFRNISDLPLYGLDQVDTTCRNRQLASEAWEQAKHECPDGEPSTDYACGFKAGFADYLDAGGTGEPPVVPPYRYRLMGSQTPEGRQAVLDWFAGFRHGSAAARASGWRELIVIPVSALPVSSERPYLPAGLTA